MELNIFLISIRVNLKCISLIEIYISQNQFKNILRLLGIHTLKNKLMKNIYKF